MKKLILFGEYAKGKGAEEFCTKHNLPTIYVNNIIKAIVIDNDVVLRGLAIHYSGLGGHITFVEDDTISFVSTSVDFEATKWWLNANPDIIKKEDN